MAVYAPIQRYTQLFHALLFMCDALEAKLEPCSQAYDTFGSLREVIEAMKTSLMDLSEKPEDSLPSLILTDEMTELQQEKEVLASELRHACCERLVVETCVRDASGPVSLSSLGVSAATVSSLGVSPSDSIDVGVCGVIHCRRYWSTWRPLASCCIASTATRSTTAS